MKRFAALIIIVLMLVSLVPAVGVSAQDQPAPWCGTDQPVTITFITGQVGGEFEVSEALVKRFSSEVCPNITVNVQARPTSTTDTLAQYQQFFEGQSPDLDVFMVDGPWIPLISEHLLDLNEYFDADMLGRFYPALIEADTVGGRLVAIPWFTSYGMLYFRTDLLDKYGLEVPQTWDDLGAAAKTIQDGERGDGNDAFWGFVYQGAAYEGLTCDALEWQVSVGGGRILTADGVVDVNNQPAIDIFDKMASWVGDIVPPEVVTYQEEDSRGVWQAGNAAFMRNWPYAYALGQADDSVIKDKFDVGPLPGGEAGMSAATLGGWSLSVSKYSANPEAAAALVNWLTEFDAAKEYTLQRGEPPVLPALYQDEELIQALPYLASSGEILNSAVSRPFVPAGDQYAKVSELYYTAVNNILSGSTDAASAMESLELDLAGLGFELP